MNAHHNIEVYIYFHQQHRKYSNTTEERIKLLMKAFQIQTLKMPMQGWKPWAEKISAIKKKVQPLPEVANSLRFTSQMEGLSHKMKSFWKSLKSNSICLKDCPYVISIAQPLFMYTLLIFLSEKYVFVKNPSRTKEATSELFPFACSEFFSASLKANPHKWITTQMESTTFPFNFVFFET